MIGGKSFRAGERIKIDPPDTIAVGIRTQQPGKLTFPIVYSLVHDIILVDEGDVIQALTLLLQRMKILVEPTGAVAPAAILQQKVWAAQLKNRCHYLRLPMLMVICWLVSSQTDHLTVSPLKPRTPPTE